MARVVVLGSSFGGITAAYQLRKLLPPRHEVLMVSNASTFVFRPSLPWVVLGLRRPEQVTADLTPGLQKRGIEFFQATVTQIDPVARRVATTQGDVDYDFLVIALGAHLKREAVPGLDAHTECILWLDDALRVREKLERFPGGRIGVLDVQGSPLACPSYEVALGLHVYLQQRGLRAKTRIFFISHANTPFEQAGPKASAIVAQELQRAGIDWRGGRTLQRVDAGAATFAGGERIEADLWLAFPPSRGTDPLVRAPALADASGFVEVDRTMRSLRFPNVYAVGDAVAFPGPKSGRMAVLQAYVAAHNLARALEGASGRKQYKSHLLCIMELGAGRALFAYRRKLPPQGPATFAAALPGRLPHAAKVLWEKYFLATRF